MLTDHILLSDQKEELRSHGTPDFPCACYENDYRQNIIPWHWHDEFELGLVETGECFRILGQERYHLRTGDGVFISSGTLHQAIPMEEQPSTGIDLVFHGRLVYGTTSSIFYKKYIHPILSSPLAPGIILRPEITWQKQILDKTRQIHQAFQTQPEGYEFQVREQLSQILFLLYKNKNCHDLPPRNNHGSLARYEHIKLMLAYIHQYFDQPITLAQIAASANICERECLRSFQEILGDSPMQYVIRHRILYACRMLTESEMTISEIASTCGFASTSYFSKIFRRIQGCTPKEYRKQ